MAKETCPRATTCPIFTELLKDTGYDLTFKSLYCEAGQVVFQTCKRLQVIQKAGKCPLNLLPNSIKEVEEIIDEMTSNKAG